MDKLTTLQERINYSFTNPNLLNTALTHSSYANENKRKGLINNERLEFLGDSVLGMAVADMIYRSNPKMPEGKMTRLRAELVCERSLASIATRLELGGHLHLGRGEDADGGRTRPSILADAVEAVLAAVYLDGGLEPVFKIIGELFKTEASGRAQINTDHKTALQELVQEKSGQVLSYHTIDESGPDHKKLFTVEVRLNHETLARGSGRSKKQAEQNAAHAALDILNQ